jgi:hypothetical protein
LSIIKDSITMAISLLIIRLNYLLGVWKVPKKSSHQSFQVVSQNVSRISKTLTLFSKHYWFNINYCTQFLIWLSKSSRSSWVIQLIKSLPEWDPFNKMLSWSNRSHWNLQLAENSLCRSVKDEYNQFQSWGLIIIKIIISRPDLSARDNANDWLCCIKFQWNKIKS